MSKELELTKKQKAFMEYELKPTDEKLECNTRFTNELQQIKQAEPSEALKCLDKLAKQIELDNPFNDKWLEDIDIIKRALLKAQEQEKVLEIIKDKWVNVAVLIHSKTVDEYNNNAHTPYNLTKEEFDTLKRWLEKCQKRK